MSQPSFPGFTSPFTVGAMLASRVSPTKRGTAALAKIAHYMSPAQVAAVRQCLRENNGEATFFADKMEHLAQLIRETPDVRANPDRKAYLHYFMGNYDAYVMEIDREDGPPAPGDDVLAYGWCRFAHMPDCAEFGYLSITEITQAGAELDFHFTPQPIDSAIARFATPAADTDPDVAAFNA
jgi:hypothetical protein